MRSFEGRVIKSKQKIFNLGAKTDVRKSVIFLNNVALFKIKAFTQTAT